MLVGRPEVRPRLSLVLSVHGDKSDGFSVVFDRDRQRVGSNNNLNTLGIQAGLDSFVNLAGGTTVVSPVTMSATVEAILGAVYLDGGLQAVTPVMQALGL